MSKLGPLTPNYQKLNPITGQHPNIDIASLTRGFDSLSFADQTKKKGVGFSNNYGGPLGSGTYIPHKSENYTRGGKRKSHKKTQKKTKKRVCRTRR